MFIVLPFILYYPYISLLKGSVGQRLQVSETNTSSVFVELLRGRDGLPGRDGAQGPAGPRGEHGLQGKEGLPGPTSGGATYIRWGKSSCPEVTGTELVYSGIAGGSWNDQDGGGSNYLCLPRNPEYSSTLRYRAGIREYSAPIHGSEYEDPLQGTHQHNVPCALCRVSTRPTVVMIPAKASCPPIWTREYYGYLMSAHKGHRRTTFECMDKAMESLPGHHDSTNGALFYHTEATCSTGLPCPPYNNHQELNCVVCTK